MKRIMPVLLCMLLLLCAGCSGDQELPTEIAEVGDVLIKTEEDLLPSRPLTEIGSVPAVNEDAAAITPDMVCEWFNGVVSDGFTEQTAEEGFSVRVASLPDGGCIEVMEYYGGYYSTTFRYSAQSGSDIILDSAACNLELYLARRLTDAEHEELRQATEAVLLGSEMQHIQTLSEFVRVTVFSEGGVIHIQCS